MLRTCTIGIASRHDRSARSAFEKPSARVTGLEPLMLELDRRAVALGIPRRTSEAPLEYWSSAPNDVPAKLRDAGVHIVESFYRARFGGARVSAEEIQSLSKELKVASGE